MAPFIGHEIPCTDPVHQRILDPLNQPAQTHQIPGRREMNYKEKLSHRDLLKEKGWMK
jgi:hypothetical protein